MYKNMYKNMLNPETLRKTANGPQLKGNEGTYDTSILKGSPVGRRDIGNSAPLPAQAEVFQKVVDEKIANFKTKGNPISIVVWHNSWTELTQHLEKLRVTGFGIDFEILNKMPGSSHAL